MCPTTPWQKTGAKESRVGIEVTRFGGPATMLGGAMQALKGKPHLLEEPNPTCSSPHNSSSRWCWWHSTTIWENTWRLPKTGWILAYLAVTLSAVNMPYSLFFTKG